ncbi:MAG TPA: hypothetical protein VHI51_14445 [Ktedonobacterales bacterium]|nr:hypothetical protein [Ktedonobacterales bacterium]
MWSAALDGDGLSKRARSRYVSHVTAVSRRLAWMSVILGAMSLDLEALAALSAVVPSPFRWYAELLQRYGSATVVVAAMFALGWPLAITGLACASAIVRRGRATYAMLLGVAVCSISVAIPLVYALFVATYVRGLL